MEYFVNGKQPEHLIDSKASKGENVVYVRVPAYANALHVRIYRRMRVHVHVRVGGIMTLSSGYELQ